MTISFFQDINVIGVLWIIFILYWGISAFFVKKSVTKRYLYKEILWRVILIVTIIILIVTMGNSFGRELVQNIGNVMFQRTLLLGIIGFIITALGLTLAIWARIYLGENWSGYVTYKKNHELVTTGPYKFIRHPIYSGVILMAIGTFIYSGLYYVFVIIIIVSILFLSRIKREEKIMTKLFGKKYLDYMKRTKALVPGVY